jgi:hypothetical protein
MAMTDPLFLDDDELADVPEGYTAEEWAAMKRCADVLDFGYEPAEPKLRDLGVAIPDVPLEYRTSRANGRIVRVEVPNKTYLIQCAHLVKIGTAANIHRRYRELEAMNALPIKLLHVFAGGHHVEGELQKRFDAYWDHDEWYRIEGELAAWIEEGCPL